MLYLPFEFLAMSTLTKKLFVGVFFNRKEKKKKKNKYLYSLCVSWTSRQREKTKTQKALLLG